MHIRVIRTKIGFVTAREVDGNIFGSDRQAGQGPSLHMHQPDNTQPKRSHRFVKIPHGQRRSAEHENNTSFPIHAHSRFTPALIHSTPDIHPIPLYQTKILNYGIIVFQALHRIRRVEINHDCLGNSGFPGSEGKCGFVLIVPTFILYMRSVSQVPYICEIVFIEHPCINRRNQIKIFAPLSSRAALLIMFGCKGKFQFCLCGIDTNNMDYPISYIGQLAYIENAIFNSSCQYFPLFAGLAGCRRRKRDKQSHNNQSEMY